MRERPKTQHWEREENSVDTWLRAVVVESITSHLRERLETVTQLLQRPAELFDHKLLRRSQHPAELLERGRRRRQLLVVVVVVVPVLLR